MRKHIFKGRRMTNGQWVTGSLLSYQDGAVFICVEEKPHILNKYKVDPETVCEWTGLYDGTKWEELSLEEQKKFLPYTSKEWQGKPIFEGDILAYSCGEVHGEYEVCFVGCQYTCKEFFNPFFDVPQDAFSEGTADFRITGKNIND